MAVHAPARVSRLGLVNSVAFEGWPTRDVRLARFMLRLTRRVAPRWLLAILRADLERGYADPTRASHSIERFVRPFASDEGRDAFMQHLKALDSQRGKLPVPKGPVPTSMKGMRSQQRGR